MPSTTLAGQPCNRRSRPLPLPSPCLGGSQRRTAPLCPLPEPREAMDHRGEPAPSATRPCRRRPQSAPCPRVHKPPLDTTRAHRSASTWRTPQTPPFAAQSPTATARRGHRRFGRAERHLTPTACHRPYGRIEALEHRQGTAHRSPSPAMPLARRSHVATVDRPSRSVSPSGL